VAHYVEFRDIGQVRQFLAKIFFIRLRRGRDIRSLYLKAAASFNILLEY
jgi:hypothetical protein